MAVSLTIEDKKFKKQMNRLLRTMSVDLSKELNIGAGVVVKDMKDRISQGKDINGSAFTKLKPSTIASKRKKGYARPDLPLVATGKMSGVFKQGGAYIKTKATPNKQEAIISAPNSKAPYGIYHQEGDGVPEREWFGISKEASANVMNLMKKRIEKLSARFR